MPAAPSAPSPAIAHASAATLERELAWAGALIDASIKLYFEHACELSDVHQLTPPPLGDDVSPYAALLRRHAAGFDARLVLVMALMPHLRPQALDSFLTRNIHFDRGFTEFGGVRHASQGGFLPTVETAAFVLCGGALARRQQLAALFAPGQLLARERMIALEPGPAGTGLFGSQLLASPELLALADGGAPYQPAFSPQFPAQPLHTALDWDDLVLGESVMDDVEEIRAWIDHGATLMNDWQLGRQLKRGFRTLFYGPPGTGKTLTATLLGKSCALDVYRVDLSQVVSKFIGETEKNLAGLFEQAERRDWILFFDEADALFGKRTQTSSSNDRYANQEVAYLLQRVEDYPGVVILATNLKSNIDEAFARRFQSMIYFPLPDAAARLALWRKAFVQPERLGPDVDLALLAAEFELSGGAVGNVTRYAALMALRRGDERVSMADIRHGIRRELRKEGKFV